VGILPYSAGIHPIHRPLSVEVHQQSEEPELDACPVGILYSMIHLFSKVQIREIELGSRRSEPPSYIVGDICNTQGF
jgi:hypothetical protein